MCSTPAAPWAWSPACCPRPSGRRNEAETRDEYIRIREQYARGQEVKARATLPQAARQPLQDRPGPDHAGASRASSACAPSTARTWQDLADHIDWTPFFASWELIGRYPQILEDEIVGEAAHDLFADAQAMLKRIIDEKWFTAKRRGRLLARQRRSATTSSSMPTRAAPTRSPASTPCASRSRSRTASPTWPCPTSSPRTGQDYIGAFAVTAGHGELEIAKRFKDAGDDYSRHPGHGPGRPPGRGLRRSACTSKVRTELWGYAADEAASTSTT